MCRWRRGELVWSGDEPTEEVFLESLRLGGHYLRCLVIALWDLEGGKTIKGAINFYVGGEGVDHSKSMDLSNYYYTILTRKYNIIFCILLLPHNIYIMAIKNWLNHWKLPLVLKGHVQHEKAFSVADLEFN